MTVPEPPANTPPLADVWSTLLDRWLALPPTAEFADRRRKAEAGGRVTGPRTRAALTEYLNETLGEHYTPQGVSQWATGSDGRTPPWNAILLLLRELKLDLVLSGDGRAWFVQARKSK